MLVVAHYSQQIKLHFKERLEEELIKMTNKDRIEDKNKCGVGSIDNVATPNSKIDRA